MRFVDTAGFVADDAWGALDLADIDNVTVRAEEGDEHVAHPVPVARILVVERKGSV